MTNLLLGAVIALLLVLLLESWLARVQLGRRVLHVEEVIVPWMVDISAKVPGSIPPPPAPPING